MLSVVVSANAPYDQGRGPILCLSVAPLRVGLVAGQRCLRLACWQADSGDVPPQSPVGEIAIYINKPYALYGLEGGEAGEAGIFQVWNFYPGES